MIGVATIIYIPSKAEIEEIPEDSEQRKKLEKFLRKRSLGDTKYPRMYTLVLAVAKDFRGLRIGTELLKEAEKRCPKCKTNLLLCADANETGQYFYEKSAGFKRRLFIDKYYVRTRYDGNRGALLYERDNKFAESD
eukprot:866345_1